MDFINSWRIRIWWNGLKYKVNYQVDKDLNNGEWAYTIAFIKSER